MSPTWHTAKKPRNLSSSKFAHACPKKFELEASRSALKKNRNCKLYFFLELRFEWRTFNLNVRVERGRFPNASKPNGKKKKLANVQLNNRNFVVAEMFCKKPSFYTASYEKITPSTPSLSQKLWSPNEPKAPFCGKTTSTGVADVFVSHCWWDEAYVNARGEAFYWDIKTSAIIKGSTRNDAHTSIYSHIVFVQINFLIIIFSASQTL
jgi:hypothetical protein